MENVKLSIDLGYKDKIETTLHELIAYLRKSERERAGAGRQILECLVNTGGMTIQMAWSLFPVLRNLEAEYNLNIKK